MTSTMQQDQLETVSALAATLADRMLMERLTRGTLPLANASRLWTASLLLEEHQRPIPRIVADVLDEVRHSEPAEEAPGRTDEAPGQAEGTPEPAAEARPAAARRHEAGPRKGRLVRILRPFQRAAGA
ncbi:MULTISPECIES: hypothetical protein [Methylobacterium]|jgi:hypothetical protein|uniref:Uncharacterized protein n=1 Tax=Methylobacterium longum TaxID=767694 RepID=A0ABT8AQD5_9HYPH|nr:MULTISPECIES: hypothetical protein [Methylobacterium]MCJ2099044.1 hypothetical protein [Methylobacterium sp. E-046]MDN3572108.1 hypothetical protein [Methylobacterium longum]GJE11090.1 hypothetical protein FOHLNKBM_2130 [Methylobacterium longum]